MLAVTAHIGLAGGAMSDETREWWGRVGGVQLLISLLLIVVGVMALAGPHSTRWCGRSGGGSASIRAAISAVLSVAVGGVHRAGVFAGRSRADARAAAATGSWSWPGRSRPSRSCSATC